MKTTTTESRIYVGTYGKYAAGSINGQWLNLSDYADKEEFLTACAALHSDEADPEFMFQDMEGIPDGMAGESFVSDELFDWLALDESDREMLAAYCAAMGEKRDIDEARDAFAGIYRDGAEFAESIAEDVGDIPKDLPSWIVIDWEASWKCNLRFDYVEQDHNGQTYFFRNC